MKLQVIVVAVVLIKVAESIPMPFRKEVPADEIVGFARYTDDSDNKDYRLPNDTIPLSYNIFLTTDVHRGEAAFSGKVRITLQAVEATSEITLHYRQITIEKIDLFHAVPDLIEENIQPKFVADVEFLKIPLKAPLTIGASYNLDISYTGSLRDDNMGFYKSSYKTSDDQTRFIATTQFEQTDARHAFPCYDEPQIRAKFTISIRHDNSYTAISNFPTASSDPDEGNYVITKFQETLPVQSYLIAFVISDFTHVENNDPRKQRVFAKPQSVANNETALALEAGKKILDKFVEILVPFTPPKIDQVAIPDFDAGAMENWGLVTYREEYLLYNEATATTRQRETILTIIAHEYAHQWFGNHVSPAWWSYLWLNEGFATLYESYLASLVYQEDRLMDLFVVETVQSVLDTDANPAIRPMTYYVESPERITDLFDRIAYDKSGSVLRMMQVALGEPTWLKGLQKYLNTMKYKSASSANLYTALQEAINEDNVDSQLNIETIMKTWETQPGYPLITVKRNGNELTFEQERFFYSEQPNDNSLWWVPINYVVGSTPDFTKAAPNFWLPAVPTFTINKPTQDNEWIVVNVQESSYYRVNYDDNLWNLLIEKINRNDFEEIHLLNRAQLVDDSLNLARAGKIEYNVPLGILRYLEKEADYVPWAAANRGMTLLNRWLTGSNAYASYQQFVRKIVEPLYNRLRVDIVSGEPKLDRYARSLAINLACQAGLPACLTQTTEKLKEVVEGGNIPADLKSVIYCNGLRGEGTTDAFNFLKSNLEMLKSEDQAERTLIIAALGCSQDESLLTDYLKSTFQPDSNLLGLQEKFRVLVAPVNNGELGLRVMINVIHEHFDDILNISPTQVSTMLSNIAPRVSSQALFTEFDSLLSFLEASEVITTTARNSYKTTANNNLEWQTKNSETIRVLLQEELNTTTVASTTSQASTSTTEETTLGAGSVMISTILLAICASIKILL